MQRRAREDAETYQRQYVNELAAIGRNAEWHESNDKYSVGKRNAQNEKQI